MFKITNKFIEFQNTFFSGDNLIEKINFLKLANKSEISIKHRKISFPEYLFEFFQRFRQLNDSYYEL